MHWHKRLEVSVCLSNSTTKSPCSWTLSSKLPWLLILKSIADLCLQVAEVFEFLPEGEQEPGTSAAPEAFKVRGKELRIGMSAF